MAIVWPCTMTAHDYAAAGRDVEVPRPDCPTCSAAMSFWGSYRRPLRLGEEIRLVVRRARCRPCRLSHALLPDFVAPARLDALEVIGAGIEKMAAGATTMAAAVSSRVPYTTARGWRRRFAARAELLAAGFLAATVALGDLVPRLPAGGPVARALCAIGAASSAARRRLCVGGSDWRLANCIVGGHLLSTNTDPPWNCR
jgi:hypothetical protein